MPKKKKKKTLRHIIHIFFPSLKSMKSTKTESFLQNDHVDETIILKIKKAELIEIKEELKKAKDSATQSWLDSRPLIDELEQLKSGLARAEKRHATSTTLISDLQLELEKINTTIKSKMEEEVNATRMVNEINMSLDQLREEMEGPTRYTDRKRQSKLKLQQVLRLRRKRLLSFQLALAAARKEAEAYGASAVDAARYIDKFNNWDLMLMEGSATYGTNTVQLSHEEYQALRKGAEERDSIATWRVSVAEEERLAAKGSRDLALTKLKEVKAGRLTPRERKVNNVNIEKMAEEEDHGRQEQYHGDDIPPKTAKEDQKPVRSRRTKTKDKKKKFVPKKRISLFGQIKLCLVRNIIRRLFRKSL